MFWPDVIIHNCPLDQQSPAACLAAACLTVASYTSCSFDSAVEFSFVPDEMTLATVGTKSDVWVTVASVKGVCSD